MDYSLRSHVDGHDLHSVSFTRAPRGYLGERCVYWVKVGRGSMPLPFPDYYRIISREGVPGVNTALFL